MAISQEVAILGTTNASVQDRPADAELSGHLANREAPVGKDRRLFATQLGFGPRSPICMPTGGTSLRA